ncbi:RNA-directed DNA polymerase, eukaryota, reverse transcriptase zinc-binding domain protein [Tanacetum coccineum]
MTKLMMKLKHLKEKIRLWNKGNTMSSINRKRTLKSDLVDFWDLIIDKVCGDVEIVNKRANVVRSLQELENLQSLEAAQKSKIKWAIEGDENSKYYHGILNKKRSQLAIRGILVDGNWIDSPHLPDQIIDLECDVSKDEIKRGVWEFRVRKALLGNRGFCSGFYVVTEYFSECMCRVFSSWSVFPKKKGPDIDHFPILEPFGVEFDVFRNKEFRDINDNHVGVDVNSLTSVNATAARYYDDGDGMFRVLRLNSGENYQVWIDYMDFEINTYPGFVTPGCLIGIMLSPSLQLSHLFYADDVIFMGQWNESNLDTIVQVLECFHSKLMGIYVDADKVTQAARKIGCVTLKTLFTYLGSKVGGHMSRIQSWNETIEAMASRLSKWKMKTLSIRALMFKWVWCFLSQNSSLWANVIKSIHGDHRKIGKQVKVSYPSIWLDIVKKVDLLKKRGLNLLSFVSKKVGNGSNTLFWEETWHGDVAFNFLFPRAYALESCKNIDVASKLSQNSLASTFCREPRGGVEQDQLDSLNAMVEGTSLINIRDRWIWSLQSS